MSLSYDDKDFWNQLKIVSQDLRILDLDYLRNHQIDNCWIGGPHGWCSWDGTIGCDGFNIGKYSSIEEVHKEWLLIAQKWPNLKLRCQLWNGEEEDTKPVVEFIIDNGTVQIIKPTTELKHQMIKSSMRS